MGTTDEEVFKQSLKEALPQLLTLSSSADCATPKEANSRLDDLAAGITASIHAALHLSTKRASTAGKGFCWWDQECSDAVANFRLERTSNASRARETHREFRSAVCKAKKDFFAKQIGQSTLDGNFFKATKWVRGQPVFASPTLIPPSGPQPTH